MRVSFTACPVLCLLAVSAYGIVPEMPDLQIVPSEQLTDSLPPIAPKVELQGIYRGFGEVELDNGSWVWNSESDFGLITIEIVEVEDDRTPTDSLGYRVHLVDGDLPEGCELRPNAYLARSRPDGSRVLWIQWNDGDHWDQDAFNFTVRVTAMDRGGNESGPSNALLIAHDGQQQERYEQMKAWHEKREREQRNDD